MKHVTKILLLIPTFLFVSQGCVAQQETPAGESPQQTLSRLMRQIDQVQAQLEGSQRQLAELKEVASSLEAQITAGAGLALARELEQERAKSAESASEEEQIQTSQIATLDQLKVESESRYPVKVGGLVLFSGLINTSGVDQPTSPSTATIGNGSTTATVRQTLLSVEAQGPTIAGAASHADLQVDFFGSSTLNSPASYGGVVRLRTAHGTLDWKHTQLFFAMDRPIVAPLSPTSLTAVAVPPLAWSGNLWVWTPQIGVTGKAEAGSSVFSVSAALVDVPDAPTTPAGIAAQAQLSRWPGAEVHLGLDHHDPHKESAIGFGGYFSPHKTPGGLNYDAWAGTLDLRTHLPGGLELSGSVYRGASLGGLGGGTYKDYLFYFENSLPTVLALDNVGGWAQLKKRAGERLEYNAALGLDQAFARQLRAYGANADGVYLGTARNRTLTGNVIYSPLAYLKLSLEYRHIATAPLSGTGSNTNVIGLAAGYKF